jgi:hypothetical protein
MDNKGKISRDVAEEEIEVWLDKKKVFQETRDKYKDHIEVIVEAMMNGVLQLNEKMEFHHTLLFEIGEGGAIDHLDYLFRANDKIIAPHMKGVKNDDVDGRLNALIAAITKQTRGIISNLDTVDKRIATAIGIFFM